MSLFSRHINCLNCENELTHLSKLVFHTPETITCDFCGQDYPGLARKIRYAKWVVGIAFLIPALVLFWILLTYAGVITALFALFPVFIIYLYILAFTIKKITDF
jgi:hypothetical protein